MSEGTRSSLGQGLPVSNGPVDGPPLDGPVDDTVLGSPAPVLEARGLRKEFRSRTRRGGRLVAVDSVDLILRRAESLALIGESGSGKSTLARCLVGLLQTDGGQLEWGGNDVRHLTAAEHRPQRRRRQMMFQDSSEALNARRTARQVLDEAIKQAGAASSRGIPRAVLAARRQELLKEVGLELHHESRYPHQLSGGQRQRLALARTLAADPDLLVLDEPVSGLDASLRLKILDLLELLRRRRGLAQLIISHDLGAARRAQRVAVMYLGNIVEEGPASQVLEHPRHPYTAGLLASRPRLDGQRGVFTVMPGEVANPEAPPPGCAFHPRCARASAECSRSKPTLKSTGSSRAVACWHPLDLDLVEDAR